MSYQHNKKLTPFAKRLRRDMTREERKIWYLFLREYPIRFLRQKVIDNYIVDFYCAQARLVIEIDGSQHYQGSVEIEDKKREEVLEEKGLKVLRFSNRQINQEFQYVCEYIDRVARQRLNVL